MLYLSLRGRKMMEKKLVVVELAEKLGINIESYDIQRAHRLGRKGSPIAKFVKYKHRNDILFSKSKLKNCNDGKFNNAFIQNI